MVVLELHGSGGHIFADVTDEQAKKADLGVGKCFLAPIGKLEEQKMQKYFCKTCESEFDGSPKIQIEDFSDANFFDSFIRAWFETKIFFNDYLTAVISIIIVIIIFAGIGYGIFRIIRRIIIKSKR